jgi:hypothetical protein
MLNFGVTHDERDAEAAKGHLVWRDAQLFAEFALCLRKRRALKVAAYAGPTSAVRPDSFAPTQQEHLPSSTEEGGDDRSCTKDSSLHLGRHLSFGLPGTQDGRGELGLHAA